MNRVLYTLVMLAVSAALAAACSSPAAPAPTATSGPSSPSATSTPVPPPVSATATPVPSAPTATARPANTPVPQAQPEGTLVVALSDIAFPAMVPSVLPVTPGGLIHRWRVYETALVWSAEGKFLEPRLATSWEADPSGTAYALHLRKGVQFHGGWGEMTAEDFKWSFEDEIREGSIHSSIALARETGAQMEVVDPYTLRVSIKGPNAFFFEAYFANVGGAATKVFSKKRIEALGAEKAALDISGGTGPFKFTKWQQGEEAVPGYYGRTPQFQTVRIVEIKETASQVAALETHEVDASIIPAPSIDRAKGAGLDVRPFGVPGSQRLYPQGWFCTKETLDGQPVDPYPRPGYDPTKPWVGECDNPQSLERARQVRWAMSMAIDRQAIVDNILAGFGRPSYLPEVTQPLLDRIWKDKWLIPYDPARARQMLADAGYANGFDALMRITTGDHALEVEMGQAVAQYLRQVGIRVTTEILTYSANRPAVVARERSDLWFRSGGGGSAEPPELVQLRRNPENAFNPGMEVREPLEIIRKMDTARSEAAADQIREELYDWLHNSQMIIPVVLADAIMAVNPEAVGQWPMSTGVGSIGDFEYAERVK